MVKVGSSQDVTKRKLEGSRWTENGEVQGLKVMGLWKAVLAGVVACR